jgi:hypothetical protein
VVFTLDTISDWGLQRAFDYCLTARARTDARRCFRYAAAQVEAIRDQFIRLFESNDPGGGRS